MRTQSVVSYIIVALAVMLTAEAVELCQLIFTSEPRSAPDLPETRPYLIQVPNQPMTIFYDDGEAIVSQLVAAAGSTRQIIAPRVPTDIMTFGVTTFKDNTPIYLVWPNRETTMLSQVIAEFPFDNPSSNSFPVDGITTSDQPAPVSVAASGDSVAFMWIGYSSQELANVMLLSRSTNTQDFSNFQLKYLNPTWAAVTFVDQLEMYGARTFLAVYQEKNGGTNLVKFDADDTAAWPVEQQVALVNSDQTPTYLSIATFKKRPNFVVTGQVETLEGVVIGTLVAVFDPDFNLVKSTMLDNFIKPSLYITPSDEIFISVVTPDNSVCIKVFEDIDLQTMEWCSKTYPLQAPSWSGLAADEKSGYVAMTVVKESQSVVDVYQCDFGCGNNVVSPIRGEECELDGANCDACRCAVGSTPSPPHSCAFPQAPLSPPVAPPTTPPTSSPLPPPSPPVALSTADVLPILDCNARINQTHFRTYLSYDTRTPGVTSVTVPIGQKNMFTPIAANQGQPTMFFAGRSTVYNTAVDITVNQPVDWLLTKYRLSIVMADSSQCPTEILFQIGITSPNPPSEQFINATIDYVAWVFNVSNNNVSINVTQGEQPDEYLLNVSVQVTIDAIIDAIEEIRSITEDSTEFEEKLKEINPDVGVTGVRGGPTGVDNPATFEAEPIAPTSSSSKVLASFSILACSIVTLL